MTESFWATEYGQNILSVEQTEIDKLLASPNETTLEDLFDEDELLQQCSNKNSQLISFLSRHENITKLVSYITRPWQEHMTQIIAHLQQQEQSKPKKKTSKTHINNNTNDNNNNTPSSPLTSPLSTGGIHTVPSIDENTPQSLAESLMTLEEQPQDVKNDTEITKPNGNISSPSIDNNNTTDPIKDTDTSTNINDDNTNNNTDNITDDTTTNNTDNIENKQDNIDDDDEFNHDLNLSDDDEDTPINDNTNNTDTPGMKKQGSIVDMLMAGPDYTDDTEHNDNDNNNIDDDDDDEVPKPSLTHDIDPELPEEVNNSSDDDDLPMLPSRLDEFQTDTGVEKVKLKYPYLASEIMNCQIPDILDTILQPNNPFLDQLFDFIQQQAPLNAVLTNYWRSCIVGLVRRNSAVVLTYIKSRKNLLSSLVEHIRDQSIMELVIALGWDPAIEELKELDEVADWMYEQQLVPKLIATLSPERSPDEHSAASYTLVDIVAKTSRSTNLVLFHCLASEEQIDALMQHMFAGNRSSLLESLSVLLALLHHYPNVSAEKQPFDEYCDDEKQQDIPPVVKAVCNKLQQFKILLDTPPNTTLLLPFTELKPPLGPVRHKVVDMIVALMRTPSNMVSNQLRDLGLIVQCIDLFFLYPWNNLLHGSVEHIIQMVVSGECAILKKALFEDCDFLNRILKARQLSNTHQETKHFRLGYMGHITRVSNTIVEFAKRNEQLLKYMEDNSEWMAFIADDLKLENEQLNTQLGGHRPSTLADEPDPEEFTFFAINDMNNNMEEEEDRDSDSDSDEDKDKQQDEDETVEIDEGEDNNGNYAMPQDVFNNFTEQIDQTKEDFDPWLNEEEDWNDFDVGKQEKKPKNGMEVEDNSNNNNAKENNNNKDEFDNWDHDPFADDVFGENNKEKEKEKEVNKEENNEQQQQEEEVNEVGS